MSCVRCIRKCMCLSLSQKKPAKDPTNKQLKESLKLHYDETFKLRERSLNYDWKPTLNTRKATLHSTIHVQGSLTLKFDKSGKTFVLEVFIKIPTFIYLHEFKVPLSKAAFVEKSKREIRFHQNVFMTVLRYIVEERYRVYSPYGVEMPAPRERASTSTDPSSDESSSTSQRSMNELLHHAYDLVPDVCPEAVLDQVQDMRNFADLFPVCYIAAPQDVRKLNSSPNEFLCVFQRLLEEDGWRHIDFYTGMQFAEAKIIIRDLALFHAVPIMIKLKEPQLYDTEIEPYTTPNPVEEEKFGSFGMLCTIMKWIENSKKLSPLRERLGTALDYSYSQMREPPKPDNIWLGIGHNRFNLYNFLFQEASNPDHPGRIKILDMKHLTKKNVLSDFCYLLMTSHSQHLIAHHFYELCDIYFDEFTKILRAYEVDPEEISKFSKENFLNEVKSRMHVELMKGVQQTQYLSGKENTDSEMRMLSSFPNLDHDYSTEMKDHQLHQLKLEDLFMGLLEADLIYSPSTAPPPPTVEPVPSTSSYVQPTSSPVVPMETTEIPSPEPHAPLASPEEGITPSYVESPSPLHTASPSYVKSPSHSLPLGSTTDSSFHLPSTSHSAPLINIGALPPWTSPPHSVSPSPVSPPSQHGSSSKHVQQQSPTHSISPARATSPSPSVSSAQFGSAVPKISPTHSASPSNVPTSSGSLSPSKVVPQDPNKSPVHSISLAHVTSPSASASTAPSGSPTHSAPISQVASPSHSVSSETIEPQDQKESQADLKTLAPVTSLSHSFSSNFQLDISPQSSAHSLSQAQAVSPTASLSPLQSISYMALESSSSQQSSSPMHSVIASEGGASPSRSVSSLKSGRTTPKNESPLGSVSPSQMIQETPGPIDSRSDIHMDSSDLPDEAETPTETGSSTKPAK